MRHLLFVALFISCAVAVSLGGLLPRSLSRTHAQQQPPGTSNSSSGPVIVNEQNAGPISEHALQQIQALMAEKAARTPVQQKISSQLIYSIKMASGQAIANGVTTLSVSLPLNKQGTPVLDITAKVDDQLLAKLKQAGATIINSFPQYNSVRVEVSLSAVEQIASFDEVIFVQPMQEATVWQDDNSKLQSTPAGFDPEHLRPFRPEFEEQERDLFEKLSEAISEFQLSAYSTGTGGVRKSEADTTHKANVTRNTYGFDGTGIKIGVISDGVRNLAAAQATGDIGPVTIIPGQSGTSAGQCSPTGTCDEGTAMLELVHDLAPGAQLFFATGHGGSPNFANNIRLLRNTYHCDIIVDDLFYFFESPFQDGQAPNVVSVFNQGIVTQAVNEVTADGALYFSSAGNSGNKNDNTSGVWEGDFVDGGVVSGPIAGVGGSGRFHQFPGGNNYNVQTVASGPIILNWSDPLGGSGNDYDLFALDSTGATVVAASGDTQNGNDDPVEGINPPPAGSRIVIVKFSGADRFLHLTTNRGRLSVNTDGQTSGHACAALAFGVAATPALAGGPPSGPFPNPHTSANVVETFSSDGPRKLFFNADGSAMTPGNFLSTGGTVRQKPDITAADRVSVTGAGGFGITFSGTSAAAPHAAAIAALLKSANPSLTPAQIRTALTTTAIDIEAAGTDRDSGVGIVMADTAMAAIGAVSGAANVGIGTATVTDVGGNANGFVEPGERATLDIPLLNTGVNAATGVTATLSSSTPGVFITAPATRSYPNLAASGGTASSATPFEFVYQEGATYAANIDFVLTFSYNGTVTRSYGFRVPTGRISTISTTLDVTAPPAPAGSDPTYVPTAGTQV
ncbi:MAG TPA: S8 family serine peptidase, partial [Pyrinomonadaceae bacterium]